MTARSHSKSRSKFKKRAARSNRTTGQQINAARDAQVEDRRAALQRRKNATRRLDNSRGVGADE